MGLTVTFTNTSTGIIGAYLWDFGDGTFSQAANPIHTYALAATYHVTLYVFGVYGGQSSVEHDVTVSSFVFCAGLDFTVSPQGFAVDDIPINGGQYIAGVGFRSIAGRVSIAAHFPASAIVDVVFNYTVVATSGTATPTGATSLKNNVVVRFYAADMNPFGLLAGNYTYHKTSVSAPNIADQIDYDIVQVGGGTNIIVTGATITISPCP